MREANNQKTRTIKKARTKINHNLNHNHNLNLNLTLTLSPSLIDSPLSLQPTPLDTPNQTVQIALWLRSIATAIHPIPSNPPGGEPPQCPFGKTSAVFLSSSFRRHPRGARSPDQIHFPKLSERLLSNRDKLCDIELRRGITEDEEARSLLVRRL
jgi:hypothetical protein